MDFDGWSRGRLRQARGDRVRFRTSVGGSVAREFERHVIAVFAHVSDGLREPSIDGAVEEQVTESVH